MQQLLNEYQDTQAALLPYFDLAEVDLAKTYAPGKWTVREILNHIVDAETVLYDRLRRVISNEKPVIWAFDQNAWCNQLDYTTFPLEINKNIFLAVRAGIVYLAKAHYVTNGTREFIHTETGLRTLGEEFEKIAWHCRHHLGQIEAALAIQ